MPAHSRVYPGPQVHPRLPRRLRRRRRGFGYWLANRKRLAAETVGRAEEQASRILRDAERENDTRAQGSDARGARSARTSCASRPSSSSRDHRQQIAGIEQMLVKREAGLIEQQLALDERDKRSSAVSRR